jgi:hypothetical protein
MQSHEQLDQRSLLLARQIVQKIDADPLHAGLEKARSVCRRWAQRNPTPAVREWLGILKGSWSEVRSVLLDDSERGRRLRQSDPFCGILSPRERWRLYKAFQNHEAT